MRGRRSTEPRGPRRGSRPKAEAEDADTLKAAVTWATDAKTAGLWEPVEALRAQLRAEGPTPELLARLRAVSMAARGGHVRDREAAQLAALEVVRAQLPEVKAEPVWMKLLLARLDATLGEPDGTKLRAVPIDEATTHAVTREGREAVSVLAWLLVRSGALVEHPPTEPTDRRFPPRLARAVNKLRKAGRKQRRPPLDR